MPEGFEKVIEMVVEKLAYGWGRNEFYKRGL
jgi:hypothetical protein